MAPDLMILVVIAFAALVAVAAYGSHLAAKRRSGELAALAARLGWSFDPTKETGSPRFESFSAFNRGHSRCAYNTLRGAIEVNGQRWPVQAGDYRYMTTSSNGKTTTTHTHTLSYAIIETSHLGTPELVIRREGLFDRMAGFMGFEDIDFESAEFSERFHVKSSDKRFAYAVLDPRMIEFLLESNVPAIEFRRGLCCLLRGERSWPAQQIDATIDWGRRFFERWPRHVPSVLDQ